MSDTTRAFYAADSLSTEVYDVRAEVVIAGSPMDGDVAFYRRLADETGGPVLDVGCGTGRVALPLAADGHDVVGVDRSAPMLRIAEQRRQELASDVGARLTFVHADLRTLALGRQFPLVITPSRVFQFMLTPEAQREALVSLRNHLGPDGLLVLDLFDPLLEFVVPGAEFPLRRSELVHPVTGNRIAWEVTDRSPDPANQLINETWTTWEIAPSGEVLRTDVERLTLRWSLRSELRLLFELVGLEVVHEHGDFHGGGPAYGREQVWVLRRISSKSGSRS